VCGIAGFVSNTLWDRDIDLEWIDAATEMLESAAGGIAEALDAVDRSLSLLASKFDDLMSFALHYRLMVGGPMLSHVKRVSRALEKTQHALESLVRDRGPSEQLERLIELTRDFSWQLEREVLGGAARACELLPERLRDVERSRGLAFLAWSIEQVLENLDRLEVRGRDSAGISIQCLISESTHDGTQDNGRLAATAQDVEDIENGVKRQVHAVNIDQETATITFIYKVANLVGRLGDNTSALRKRIQADSLLWETGTRLRQVNIISHTRWASNGIISLSNCHPTDGSLAGKEHEPTLRDRWAQFVLNGDVDNYYDLRLRFVEERGYAIDASVTTDAKILPLVFRLAADPAQPREDRFGDLMKLCEGSLAVVMQHPLTPMSLYLGEKGSGQSLFLGRIRDGVILASEVYGLASLTRTSYSLVGTERGGTQVLVAPADDGFTFQGRYLDDKGVFEPKAEPIYIHSRDIFRGRYDYYFEKEIHEAPISVLKTIKGKYRKGIGKIEFNAEGYESFGALVSRLRDPHLPPIRRVMVIGQGTASVAAMGVAHLVAKSLAKSRISVQWSKASEMSGFLSGESLVDTLLIAISQSGTTTDTNRTVDVAAAQGAWIHAIVNRRNSPLVEKADSHFYTSDGRDVEMAVASTKAFYSQIAAGKLTALLLAQEFGSLSDEEIMRDVAELEKLPGDIQWVLNHASPIQKLAERYGPTSRNWAVVGNGPNKIAADEIRIKLSELCYKSIPCDFTEDKKHIDLSTEPLTIVVANDLPEEIVQDTVKEVAIFKAHNGRPLVICSRGEKRFRGYAESIIEVPTTGADLGFVTATVAGHLWGFYAARAIDARADVIRNLRTMLTVALEEPATWNSAACRTAWQELAAMIEEGEMNAALPASTVAALFGLRDRLLSDALQEMPPEILVEGIAILKQALEEVTRPIDTIRHQAKTVTVGISRPQVVLSPVFLKAMAGLSADVSRIKEADLRMLKNLGPVIADVPGGLFYKVLYETDAAAPSCAPDSPMIQTIGRYGVCEGKESRYDAPNCAGGSKKTALRLRRAIWSSGRLGQENLLVIPLYADKNEECTGLLLFHVVFVERASLQQKLGVLRSLGNRYYELIERLDDTGLPYSLEDILEKARPRDLVLMPVDTLVLETMGK